MSHDAQSSKYKHNIGGGPASNGMGNGNPMGGGMGGGMNPMGGMGNAMGGGGAAAGGFDPNAMAAMYQKMMMSESISFQMSNPADTIVTRHEHVEPHDVDERDEPK